MRGKRNGKWGVYMRLTNMARSHHPVTCIAGSRRYVLIAQRPNDGEHEEKERA